MVDGGATAGNFINQKRIKTKRDFKTGKLTPTDLTVQLADGHVMPITHAVPSASVTIDRFQDRAALHIADLGDIDVVLGKPWLAKHNPHLNINVANDAVSVDTHAAF